MKTYGEVGVPFLTSALDGGNWAASRPDRFTIGEAELGIRCIGGLLGPRTGLDVTEKKKSCLH
jgi:hypothetical protein